MKKIKIKEYIISENSIPLKINLKQKAEKRKYEKDKVEVKATGFVFLEWTLECMTSKGSRIVASLHQDSAKDVNDILDKIIFRDNRYTDERGNIYERTHKGNRFIKEEYLKFGTGWSSLSTIKSWVLELTFNKKMIKLLREKPALFKLTFKTYEIDLRKLIQKIPSVEYGACVLLSRAYCIFKKNHNPDIKDLGHVLRIDWEKTIREIFENKELSKRLLNMNYGDDNASKEIVKIIQEAPEIRNVPEEFYQEWRGKGDLEDECVGYFMIRAEGTPPVTIEETNVEKIFASKDSTKFTLLDEGLAGKVDSEKKEEQKELSEIEKLMKDWNRELLSKGDSDIKWHTKSTSDEFKKIMKDIDDIVKKHPEFYKNSDFQKAVLTVEKILRVAIDLYENEKEKNELTPFKENKEIATALDKSGLGINIEHITHQQLYNMIDWIKKVIESFNSS